LGLTAVANLLFSISHSLKSLTKKNHSYVWLLSQSDDVGLLLNPYPTHYSLAFASSEVSSPCSYRLFLPSAFPCGDEMRLIRST
jgi:hypothetical protein